MAENETKRLSRLAAILTQLQAKRVLTAASLAAKFGVSTRTIYRDIKALEQAGVPIVTEEGKGYSLLEGYSIPPVMFSENEANALLTAELLIRACKDESLIKEFSSAIQKIKAVIPNRLKDRIETLENSLAVARTYTATGLKSQHLLEIQKALLECLVIDIGYTNMANEHSRREVQSFAVYSNANDEWLLIAYCRLRKELRSFRLDRITGLTFTGEKFEPYPITFAQYRKIYYGD